MGLDQELNSALRGFTKAPTVTFTAKVLTVDKEARSCTVEDVDGLDYHDVRLNAAIDNGNMVTVFPAEGSQVLVTMIGNSPEALFVSLVTEVESLAGAINATEFEVDAQGYKIDRDGENLKAVLNDMIDELNKIKVIYGNTLNIAEMLLIKNRLNTILK